MALKDRTHRLVVHTYFLLLVTSYLIKTIEGPTKKKTVCGNSSRLPWYRTFIYMLSFHLAVSDFLPCFVIQFVSCFTFLRGQERPFLRSFALTQLANFIPTVLIFSCTDVRVRLAGFTREVAGAFHCLSSIFSIQYLSLVSKSETI